MKYNTIVFDCNNIYYRYYSTRKEETYKVGSKTIVVGGIKGFLQHVEKMRENFLVPGGKLIFGFDNQASKMNTRKEIDPGYKANRTEKAPVFYKSLEYLQLILLNCYDGAELLYRHSSEFDDMALPLIYQLPEKESVLISTNDMDFFRLIDYKGRNIKIWDGKAVWDKNAFADKYGFDPTSESVVLYKSIRGDRSDNIDPAVEGFPKRLIVKAVENFGDVYTLLKHIEIFREAEKGGWKERLYTARHKVKLNAQLVDFIQSEHEDISSYLHKCTFNAPSLSVLLSSLGFPDNYDGRVWQYTQNKKAKEQGLQDDFFVQPQVDRV